MSILLAAAIIAGGYLMIDEQSKRTMRDIEKIFLENKFNHMPVVNDDMRLVGIITRKDFLKAIHEEDELAELLQTR